MCFCLISSIPMFDFQTAILNAMHSAHLIKENARYTIEFYISLIFHHLSYNPSIQNEITLISDKTTPLAKYYNYKASTITIPNFTFRPLLENIKIEYLIMIIKLLLLEKKVILIRDNSNDNGIVIESIIMLLFPLYILVLSIVNGIT